MPIIRSRRADTYYWIAWFDDEPEHIQRGRTHYEAVGRLIFWGSRRGLFFVEVKNEEGTRLIPCPLPESMRPDTVFGREIPPPFIPRVA